MLNFIVTNALVEIATSNINFSFLAALDINRSRSCKCFLSEGGNNNVRSLNAATAIRFPSGVIKPTISVTIILTALPTKKLTR